MEIEKRCINCNSDSIYSSSSVNCYRIFKCRVCGFAWVDRDDLVSAALKPDYDDYDYNKKLQNTYIRKDEKYQLGMEMRLIKNGIVKYGQLSFLDVGCANGEFLKVAQRLGFSYVAGVEVDKVAVERAKEFGEVKYSCHELTRKKYDVIQIKNVISNITDYKRFILDYVEMLNNGGIIFIDTLNQDSIADMLKNLIHPNNNKSGRYKSLRPPYVINGFNKKSLYCMMDELGLNIKNYTTLYVGHPYFPYSMTFRTIALGVFGNLFSKASIMVTDCQKM